MDPSVDKSTSTTFCPFCNIHLSYPVGSVLIQCPSCHHTLDPTQPHQTRCTGCQCLLAYPPNSLYIQCPKCFNTMDPRLVLYGNQTSAAAVGTEGSKKRRDPNAPKAVCNAYMIFCKTRRAELKQQNPDLPFGKIGARLGEMWRNMDQEQKKPYEDRAAVDRERYRKEMMEYQVQRQTGGSEPDSKKQRVSSSDDVSGGGEGGASGDDTNKGDEANTKQEEDEEDEEGEHDEDGEEDEQ